MKNVRLYEITNDIMELENMMEGLEREATTEEEIAAIEAEREQVKAEMLKILTGKGGSIIARVNDYKAKAAAAAEESKRLSELSSYYTKQATKIEEYAAMCLEGAGIPKLETELGRISLRKGSKSLEVIDENLVPEAYMTEEQVKVIPPRVDKVVLKKAIKDLDEEGMKLIGVKMVTGKTKLVIK